MNQYERRQHIYNALCIRRYDTIANLAAEFNVNEKTIRRDIVWLTLSFPVEASPGRYGGVRIAEWFLTLQRAIFARISCQFFRNSH